MRSSQKNKFESDMKKYVTTFCLLGVAFFGSFSALSAASQTALSSFQCAVCSKENARLCSKCKVEGYCGREHQTSHWSTHKIICKSLKKDTEDNRVELRDSKIPNAGKGLFARTSFSSGERVALYHGKFVDEDSLNFEPRESPYNLRNGEGKLIQGFHSDVSCFKAGALVNDPYMKSEWIETLLNINCESPDKKAISDVLAGYLKNHYEGRSPKANVEIVNSFACSYPYFIATRPIKANDEILWHYGVNYWMSIPERICGLKGFPEVSLDVKKIVIDELKKLPKSQSSLRERYMPEDAERINLIEDRKTLMSEENRIKLQIASVLGGHDKIQIIVEDVNEFANLVARLNITETLQDIAGSSVDVIFDHQKGYSIHPRAKQLALAMIEEKNRHHGKMFHWYDMRKQQCLTDKMMIELLSTEQR